MQAIELSRALDRAEHVRVLNDSTWPEFLLHGDVRNWSSLYGEWSDFQLLILDRSVLAGAGLTVPLAWHRDLPTPETIDEVLVKAHWPLGDGGGVLCALAALAAPDYRGRGLGRLIIREMSKLADRKGLSGVLAPVRPTRKHEFPYEPMERYLARQDGSGRTLDPWIRVHQELGGQDLGILHRALTVRGTIGEWEQWTGARYPTSGDYRVQGALVPVRMNLERDIGEYVEPNVWYLHSVAG